MRRYPDLQAVFAAHQPALAAAGRGGPAARVRNHRPYGRRPRAGRRSARFRGRGLQAGRCAADPIRGSLPGPPWRPALCRLCQPPAGRPLQSAAVIPARTACLSLLTTLRAPQRTWLAADLLAGLSVCIVMIPSVIAYAELAGLAPQHGLYAALAGMLGYALLASSPQVVAGPDAAITLLVAGAIAPLAGGDPARAATLAALVALLGGVLMLLAAALRAGVVADFLSKPVLVGYMSGAALILISTQLGKLCGLRLEQDEFFLVLGEAAQRWREVHGLTLGLGLGLIALLAAARRLAPRIPGALLVFIVALLLSAVLDLPQRGVRTVGPLPGGLPAPAWPAASLATVRELLPAAAGIVLLTFPEAVLLARAFAARRGYAIRPNQELVALAAGNIAAGLFGGFSIGASQSRTTVGADSGGRTQVVSLVAAAALVAFLLFFTPLLQPLPVVALAAILVFAGAHLIELREYRRLYRMRPAGFWLALAVTLGVLVVGVVPGILVGVLASLLYLLARLARPLDAVLHAVPGTRHFHDLGQTGEPDTVPGLIAYRVYAPLFFANAEHFVQRVRELIAASPRPVRWFVIDMQAVWEIDLTAAEALARLAQELAGRGVSLRIARANRPLREQLGRIGLQAQLGDLAYFGSVHAAIEAYQQEPAPPAATAGPAPPAAGLPSE